MKPQTSNTGFMPRSIAITLLTSSQSKTNGFRKRCFRAMEKICVPLSRSTALPVSAPKTGQQRLQSRLAKASAAQLHRWWLRTVRRGNRFQDLYSDIDLHADPSKDAQVKWIEQQIVSHDALCETINTELTNRAARGKGYQKPFNKWDGRLIES